MSATGHVSVCITTFGCQMNRHDSEVLGGMLERAGFVLADAEDAAEVVLFNTCSVRDHAEQRVLGRIGSLKPSKREGTLKLIGVIGCMAERLGSELAAGTAGVDLVVGTGRLAAIPGLIERALASSGPVVATGEKGRSGGVAARGAIRPRAFQAYVSVIRGCNCGCSYCIVPSVRGREMSREPEEIVRDVRALVDEGVLEVTLLGQNIDRYGRDLARRPTLGQLLRMVDAVPGLNRLRFVTSHPRDVTDELLEAVRDCETACEYLHAPAQSGSSRVLKAMRRGYDRAAYLDMVERARGLVPGIEIASDFIAGFPGETEDDHSESLSLVREARFQNGFFFKYSPRPGTTAAALADDVREDVKRRRHAELLAAQREVSTDRNSELVGSEVEILVEGASKRDPERMSGRSRTWRICVLPKRHMAEPGELVRAMVVDSTALTLFCEAV